MIPVIAAVTRIKKRGKMTVGTGRKETAEPSLIFMSNTQELGVLMIQHDKSKLILPAR